MNKIKIYKKKLKNFICKICLDYASKPVVTFCGHIYCWECIFLWNQHKINKKDCSNLFCPICLKNIKIKELIPLYVIEEENIINENIPNRPKLNKEKFKINDENLNREELYHFGIHYQKIYWIVPIILFLLTPNISYLFNWFFQYLIFKNNQNVEKIRYIYMEYFYKNFIIEILLVLMPFIFLFLIFVIITLIKLIKIKITQYFRRNILNNL